MQAMARFWYKNKARNAWIGNNRLIFTPENMFPMSWSALQLYSGMFVGKEEIEST